MDEKVFDQPIRDRGLSIKGFVVESVTLDDESNKKIDEYELSSNTAMQRGKLVGSYGDAVKDAANNANGAANGFMGVGMMNMASNGMGNSVMNDAFSATGNGAGGEVGSNTQGASGAKFCSECGSKLTPGAKFCPECGNKI